MKAGFNSKEREIADWIQLFVQADHRFKLVGAKVPSGSNLALIHARWEEDGPQVSNGVAHGDH